MPQIGVGINEDVFISKIEQDLTSKAIIISFAHKDDKVGTAVNYFEMLQADTIVEASNGTGIRLFAPNEPKADKTEEQRIQFAAGDIAATRAIIEHIMQGYMPSDVASAKNVVYENTGIDQNNFTQKIVQKPVLLAIHENLTRHFINGMKEFVGKPDLLFRLLLVRQSKDNPYPTFRKRYISDNPFWESMDVPADQSKVKFTSYELKEGLDSNAPAPSKSDADKKQSNAPTSASSVFGGGRPMFG
jgi:hypothetical protein